MILVLPMRAGKGLRLSKELACTARARWLHAGTAAVAVFADTKPTCLGETKRSPRYRLSVNNIQ
jgi:hypothetical protein